MANICQLDVRKNKEKLSDVMRLWRADSATLGFFTSGAFEEYAEKGQILVALDSSDCCVGYLLYRISRDCAVIVHLCVAPMQRGQGAARLLVDYLKQQTSRLRGIRLSCRRDYEVASIWPKFGFVALEEHPGRSHEGKPLTTWWFDHGHPTLFSSASEQALDDKICVAIDANIFFDMGDAADEESAESKTLIADWVQANVELCVTPELFNEIDRNNDPSARDRERKRAHWLRLLQGNRKKYEEYERALRPLYSKPLSPQDESDIRQVAYALSADAQFFVTRDSILLDHGETIYKKFGLSVIRPSDLIIHLDRLESEQDYQPVRLAGTGYTRRPVQSGELEELIESFQQSAAGETAAVLRRTLVSLASDPQHCGCYVIRSDAAEKIALYAYKEKTDVVTEVPLLRVRSTSLGQTIARYVAATIHLRHSSRRSSITRVTDNFLHHSVTRALVEANYILAGKIWTRIGVSKIGPASSVIDTLEHLSSANIDESHLIKNIVSELNQKTVFEDSVAGSEIEKSLWPAKITNLSLTNYIIPIKPAWAKDLFDENLANEDLFGAKLDLALQQEGVYYRKNHFEAPKAPGRILWYVSNAPGFRGSGYVRACSVLDAVLVGKPKELYGKFRRLGVYDWKNIYEASGRDLDVKLMVIRFSHTELFENPIPWATVKMILKDRSVKSNLRSPQRIDVATFTHLYKMGRNINEEKT